MGHPNCFGIRHLSPAGAYHLRSFLDEKQPDLILVEGPSDFNGLMDDMVREETKPPFAVMAFTKDSPIRTVLYPFAEYSPEYQAIVWAKEHGAQCPVYGPALGCVFGNPAGRGGSGVPGTYVRLCV